MIKEILGGAALVTAVGTIGGGALYVDKNYVDKDELAAAVEELDPFVQEYRQQRIWDLEENIEKSDDRDEAERWMRRLRSLIAEYCQEYPGGVECEPDYLDDLVDLMRAMP